MIDPIRDQNLNLDVIIENLNQVEGFQNDFDSYYDNDSNKTFFTAIGSVETIVMRPYNSKAKGF